MLLISLISFICVTLYISVSTNSIYTDISLSNMTFYNMKSILPESLKLLLIITGFLLLFSYLFSEDYHDLVDNLQPTMYTCDKIEGFLIGGWHPDIPKEKIEQCRKLKQLQEKRNDTTT